MTYEEFLDWADEDTWAEWVDGRVEMASPANAKHQLVAGFLYKLLSGYVTFRQLGTVLIPPFQMKLPRSSGREPDLIFLDQSHISRLKETFVDGPVDLALEVISPESVTRDRNDKFKEYQSGGVNEYWLLDPDARQADFYQLHEGRYQLVLPDAQGIYHSRVVPGFWLNVAWLWQSPLPDEQGVLLDIIGRPYADFRRQQMQERGL